MFWAFKVFFGILFSLYFSMYLQKYFTYKNVLYLKRILKRFCFDHLNCNFALRGTVWAVEIKTHFHFILGYGQCSNQIQKTTFWFLASSNQAKRFPCERFPVGQNDREWMVFSLVPAVWKQSQWSKVRSGITRYNFFNYYFWV